MLDNSPMLSVLSTTFLPNVLIGSRPPCQGVEFATMEYWVRLRVPMDQAIRLYRVSMFVVSSSLWFYARHGFPNRQHFLFCFRSVPRRLVTWTPERTKRSKTLATCQKNHHLTSTNLMSMSLDAVMLNPGDKVRIVWRNKNIFKHFRLRRLDVTSDRTPSLKKEKTQNDATKGEPLSWLNSRGG